MTGVAAVVSRVITWLRTARVPMVAIVVGGGLSTALLVTACVMLATTERLRSELGETAGVWAPTPPVPEALRAFPAAMERAMDWSPGEPPTTCAVLEDPLPADFPVNAPAVEPGNRAAAASTEQPPLLVCDGSNPIILPSVAWERGAWRQAGGSPLAFRPAEPPCELTQHSADIRGRDVMAVLSCVGQPAVQVPAGGEGVVSAALYRDLAARWALSGMGGNVR